MYLNCSIRESTFDSNEEEFAKLARDQDTMKAAFLTQQASVAYYNYRNTNATVIPSRQVLFVTPFNIFFRKHSCLTRAINNEINKYLSSGILFHWVRRFFDRKYLLEAAKAPPSQHTPLGMRNVQGIFSLWFFMLMVSSLVFLLERLSRRVAFLCRVFNII